MKRNRVSLSRKTILKLVAGAILAVSFVCVVGLSKVEPRVTALKVQVTLNGTGLTGEYFQDTNFADHRISRIDPTINFDWTGTTPDPSITGIEYSARWSGYLRSPTTGSYRLRIEVLGDAYQGYVTLNEALVINWTQSEVPIHTSYPISLQAGTQYPFDITFVTYFGSHGISLKWEKPNAAGVWEVIPAESMYPAVSLGYATYFTLASSGPSALALYFQLPPGSVGANLYRSTASGAQNFQDPINGTTPASASSYSGSPTKLYVDQSVTSNTEYFYVAKAAFTNPVTGWTTLSSPTEETSEVYDADSIPWHTNNSSQILSKLEDLSPEDISGAEDVTLSGPDGFVYSSLGSGPPSAVWDGVAGEWNYSGVGKGASPNESSSLLQNPTGGTPPHTSGPIFRRLSTTGFRYMRGQVFLPSGANITVTPYTQGGSSTHDTPWIYVGCVQDHHGAKPYTVEVDAGLQWQFDTQMQEMRWRPAIVCSDKRDINLGNVKPRMAWHSLGASFEPTETVTVEYFFQRATAVETAAGPKVMSRNVFLKMTSATTGARVVLSALCPPLPANRTETHMKRCVSIAQNLFLASDRQVGYRVTGSRFTENGWQLGRLGSSSSTNVAWPIAGNDTGSFYNGITYTQNFPTSRVTDVTVGPIQRIHIHLD